MSYARRAPSRRNTKFSTRRGSELARRSRRLQAAERLELRTLMAGDVVNPFHNSYYSQDVNNDYTVTPLDALLVINELNAGGSRQLVNQSQGAQGEDSPGVFMDVNGDGFLTPLDALDIINFLNAGGETGAAVQYRTAVLGPNGQALTAVSGDGSLANPFVYEVKLNDRFSVQTEVLDRRPITSGVGSDTFNNDALGVFFASTDLVFNPSLVRLGFSESQTLSLAGVPEVFDNNSGAPLPGATLQITVPGFGTTANINIFGQADQRAVNLSNIRTGLNTILGGLGSTTVTNNGDDYLIKFTGRMTDIDINGLLTTSITQGTATVTQGFNPVAVDKSVQDNIDYALNYFRLYAPLPSRNEVKFEVYKELSSTVGVIERIGAIATGDTSTGGLPKPATGPDNRTDYTPTNSQNAGNQGYVRIVSPTFVATQAGDATFSVNAPGYPTDDVEGGTEDSFSKTLFIGNTQGQNPVVLRESIAYPNNIIVRIVSDVSANDDPNVVAVEEGGQITIDVAANDTNNQTPPGGKFVTGFGVLGTTTTLNTAKGVVTLDNGQVKYTPNANAYGTDTFIYGLSDTNGGAVKDTGLVTITITEVNDPPVATADGGFTTAEDTPLVLTTLLNNDNAGPDPIIAGPGAATFDVLKIATTNTAGWVQPANGVVTVAADGLSATYTPNQNFNGPDSFTYVLTDGRGGTATAVVSLNVTAVNDPPTFTIGTTTHTSAEDAAGTQTVAAFVTNVNPGPVNSVPQETGTVTFTVTPVSVPATLTFTTPPTITVNGTNGQLTYKAAPDAYGTATFNVVASDGSASSAPVLITIDVTPVNDPPDFVISNANVTSNEDVAGNQANFLTGISAGPNEGTAGVTFVVNVQNPSSTLSFLVAPAIDATGRLTYTPAANAFGTATIEVVAHDNGTPDLTTTKTFTLTVTSVNDAPDAVDDPNLEAPDGETTFLDVLANDSSAPDVGAPGEVLLVDPAVPLVFLDPIPNGVSVTIKPDGSGLEVTSPFSLFTGSLRVQYTIRDRAIGAGGSLSDTATATINFVSAALPRAVPDTFPNTASPALISEDNGVFSPIDVLANDRVSVTGDTLAITGIRFPGQSTFETGVDTEITDASGNKFKIAPDGLSLLFQPGTNVYGNVSVEYRIEESPNAGDGPSIGTATVTVTEVNDDPVAGNDSITLLEDAGSTNLTSQMLSNDNAGVDPTAAGPGVTSFDVLKITQVNGGVAATNKGTVAVDASGVVTYTPNANASGSDTFTYTLSDGRGGTALATVNITLTEVNDPPSFVVGNSSSAEDAGDISQTLITSINPGPANADPQETGTVSFAVTLVSSSPTLTFTTPPAVDSNGQLTYRAAPNAYGVATFSVIGTDNAGAASAPVTFTITVNETNDNPVAGNDSITITEDASATNITSQMLSNDNAGVDPTAAGPGVSTFDVLKITQVNGGVAATSKGTVSVDANGVVTYTPNNNASGTDSFIYTLSDGRGGTTTATVNISITEVNDPPTFVVGNITRNEDAGLVTQPGFVSSINPGPVNANPQETGTVTFAVTLVNKSSTLTFTSAPTIDSNGQLTFQAADNAYGVATYSVVGTDNGGAATAPVQFTITITEVNDPPIANADGPYQVFKQTTSYEATPALTANDSNGVDAGVPGEILRISAATITTATGDTGSPAGADAALSVSITANGQSVILNNPNGFFGQVIVTYTLTDRADGSGLTATSTATFNVVNFVPGTISGYVFADVDDDGILDPAQGVMGPERRLGGIEIYITGTSQFGGTVTMMVRTDATGRYQVEGLEPGTYSISLDNPATANIIENAELMIDGKDIRGTTDGFGTVTSVSNNKFQLAFDENGTVVQNLNFALLGLMPKFVNIRDHISSATSNGVVFGSNLGATALADQQFWFSLYDGWDGATDVTIKIQTDLSSAVIEAKDASGVMRTKTLSFTNDYTKIRVMGRDGNNIVVRLVGTAEEIFGASWVTQAEQDASLTMAQPQGEGAEYAAAADEVFGEYAMA